MRWFGIGNKTKDYFDSPLQLESASAISVGSNLTAKLFVASLREFFKSLPVFLIFGFVFLYLEMLTPIYYPSWLGAYNGRQISGVLFLTLISWVFMFGAPVLYAKLFFQENPRDFGMRMPADKVRALLWLIAGVFILVPYVMYCSSLTNFRQYYTFEHLYWPQVIFINFLVFPVQYIAEEFFFRGFLFIGIWRKVKWHSFWITDVLFTFAHMGKPGLEVLLCIPASIVFNALTMITKSIYPAIILHTCCGISMFLLVNGWH